jgi:uncharacterized cupredoxin-like copper-binding protein
VVAQHGDEASYVDLSKLKSMNRDSEYHSSVTFPQDMLEAVAKVNDTVIEADAGNIYIIVVSQKDSQANSSFSIAAAAQGVRLANELSMKTFREVCARNTKHVVERGDDPDEVIVKEGSPGDVSWRFEKDAYLHLRVSRPGEEPWLRVWVEPQLLLEPL